MTTRRSFWKGFALTFGMLAGVGVALAATFNLFQPANGILKGNPSTYVTTAATSADVVATFSGTCDATTALRGDGSCGSIPAGTVTSVGLTMPSGFSVGGSPVTTSGTLAVTTTLNGPLRGNGSGLITGSTSLTTEVSGTLPVANGGTGVATLANDSLLMGNGTSAMSAKAVPSCSGASNALTYNVSTDTWGCNTIASGGTPGGSDTQIQYNSGGVFAGDADFTWTALGNILTIGNGGATSTLRLTGTNFDISGGVGLAAGGVNVRLVGGDVLDADDFAGNVELYGGTPGIATTGSGGSVTLLAGNARGAGNFPGNVSITAGSRLADDGQGGAVTITGGGANTNTGGNVTIAGGVSTSGTDGSVRFQTNAATRLTIDGVGAWNMAGTTPGTSGQVLTSNGSGSAPTWQDGAQVVTGSTTFSLSPCTGSVTGTINFVKVGNMVQATAQPRTCTISGSPSTFLMSFTYPAGFEPSPGNTKVSIAAVTNNNVETVAKVMFGSSICGGGICFSLLPSATWSGTAGNYPNANSTGPVWMYSRDSL